LGWLRRLHRHSANEPRSDGSAHGADHTFSAWWAHTALRRDVAIQLRRHIGVAICHEARAAEIRPAPVADCGAHATSLPSAALPAHKRENQVPTIASLWRRCAVPLPTTLSGRHSGSSFSPIKV